jgi:hypothetical protein
MEVGMNLSDLPLDENAHEASDLEELRAANRARSVAEARMLRAVARCAERRRFRKEGFQSMTDWLSTELPIGLRTAREWVVLSNALRSLPKLRQAYGSGALTPEQMAPVARMATAEDDARWAEAAPHLYPSQLWREKDRRTRVRLKDQRAIHRSRYLSLVWDPDRPQLRVEGRLGKEQGSALEDALRERMAHIAPDPDADDPSDARRADALVSLATGEGADRTAKPHMVFHVSAEVLDRTAPRSGPWLCETERGLRLHPETARRLACDPDVELVVEDEGRPLGVGRKSSRIPGWLERLDRHRDGGACRFQGCDRKIGLLSHHIRHWADGGATDLRNLVTLCPTHHRYVHEDGWRIAGDPADDLRFHDPTGRALARASPPAPAA